MKTKMISFILIGLLIISSVTALSIKKERDFPMKDILVEETMKHDKEAIAEWYLGDLHLIGKLIQYIQELEQKILDLTLQVEELEDRSCGGGSHTEYITNTVTIDCTGGCPSVSCPFGTTMKNVVRDACGCLDSWDCVDNPPVIGEEPKAKLE